MHADGIHFVFTFETAWSGRPSPLLLSRVARLHYFLKAIAKFFVLKLQVWDIFWPKRGNSLHPACGDGSSGSSVHRSSHSSPGLSGSLPYQLFSPALTIKSYWDILEKWDRLGVSEKSCWPSLVTVQRLAHPWPDTHTPTQYVRTLALFVDRLKKIPSKKLSLR